MIKERIFYANQQDSKLQSCFSETIKTLKLKCSLFNHKPKEVIRIEAKDLLPKNKFDTANLEKIASLSDDEMKPIIYELLEWIQDYNWPVAQEILPILIARKNLIVPYLSMILNGNDSMWKYWMMELIIPELTHEDQMILKKDIEHLSQLTQQDEDSLEIVNMAKKCLSSLQEKMPKEKMEPIA